MVSGPEQIPARSEGQFPQHHRERRADLWIYYPKFQSAEHYSLGKRSPLDAGIAAITASLNLENVEATYNITGHEVADGYQLQLTPRNPSMKRFLQSFSLRMNNELQVVRTEMLQPNGDRIVTTYANESRAPIPASTFEFTPPPGTDVTNPSGAVAISPAPDPCSCSSSPSPSLAAGTRSTVREQEHDYEVDLTARNPRSRSAKEQDQEISSQKSLDKRRGISIQRWALLPP